MTDLSSNSTLNSLNTILQNSKKASSNTSTGLQIDSNTPSPESPTKSSLEQVINSTILKAAANGLPTMSSLNESAESSPGGSTPQTINLKRELEKNYPDLSKEELNNLIAEGAIAQNSTGRPLSHKCPKCSYRSAWRSCVLTHMKLKHSNERPWRCSQCTKCYKLKHHLKQHMETAHGETPNGTHKVTIKGEADLDNSLTSLPSMDAAAKQFLKLSKDSTNQPMSGTLEALVHSAFGGGDENESPSKPTSPNGPSSPKHRKLDSELINIFNTSGLAPSQLASQISQSLGLNVKIEDDGQMVIDDDYEDEENKDKTTEKDDDDNNMDHQTINTTPTRILPTVNGHNSKHNQHQHHNNQPTVGVVSSAASSRSSKVNGVKRERASEVRNNDGGGGAVESISTKEHKFKSNSAGVKGQHTCKYCLITFPDNILYGLHMGQHCVSEPFKCNICSYNCTDRYDFMFHFAMGRHEKQKN